MEHFLFFPWGDEGEGESARERERGETGTRSSTCTSLRGSLGDEESERERRRDASLVLLLGLDDQPVSRTL